MGIQTTSGAVGGRALLNPTLVPLCWREHIDRSRNHRQRDGVRALSGVFDGAAVLLEVLVIWARIAVSVSFPGQGPIRPGSAAESSFLLPLPKTAAQTNLLVPEGHDVTLSGSASEISSIDDAAAERTKADCRLAN
jgi:hypothetical protein